MIKIKEQKPRKISGLTSFTLEFDFNPKYIDIIKSLPTRYYKDKIWEVSADELSTVLDQLVFYDDIELHLLNKPAKEWNIFSWLKEDKK